MRQNPFIAVLAGTLFWIGLTPAVAQDQLRDQQQLRDQAYGWQLMSEEERQQHRQQMQQMKTEQEREAFRLEHHKKMMERAKKQGVTLPEVPGPQGKGMGPGMMMSPGPHGPQGPEQFQNAYGWQLMNDEERNNYRQQMQQMKTEQERERFRKEHHKKMQERAKKMGVTLPDEPGPHGKGMGPGMMMGPGGMMGTGGGSGTGGMGGGKH